MSTMLITTDYVLPAGQQVSSLDAGALSVEGSQWTNVTLNGAVVVTITTNAYPVSGVAVGTDSPGTVRTLTIGPTGSISVISSITGSAGAIASGGFPNGEALKVLNLGSIEVRSPGDAQGVGTGSGGFENRGTITVTSTGGNAAGVSIEGGPHDGGSFINSGAILVTGGGARFQGATGVRIYNHAATAQSYVNTGTIRVSHVDPMVVSVGVVTAGPSVLSNSGQIEADRALSLVRNDNLVDGIGNHVVDNSGALRGEVYLNNATLEPVILANSGLIQGAVTLNLGNDTYNGVGGTLTGALHGADGADSLIGGAGAETLSGDAGDDIIDGGGGRDDLDGGDGADTLSFASAPAGVTLDVGLQTVSTGVVFRNFERYVGSGRDDTILGSSGADTLSGLDGADTVGGGLGDDRIDGGDGQGVLRGDEGSDTITGGLSGDGIGGGAGNDSIAERAGSNVLRGDDGADTIVGGAESDDIGGGTGADSIADAAGSNYLRGDEGDDVIHGGADFDDANGNMGNDTVSTGAGDDYAVGGKDNDSLSGEAGGDVVWGNLGNDTQDGGDGNDQVRGGQGDDTITGGAGDDFVSGDRGNDTIAGGLGADLFHGSQDAGIDRVVDFSVAQGDRVMLDPGTTYAVSQVGADTVLDMGGGHQMVLVGVQMSSLPAGWIL